MRSREAVAAFILAGGASSRMGHNKGLVKIAGVPLILRTARLVEPLVSSVTIVGPPRPYRSFGLATISDKIPGVSPMPAHQGPLAGILTALGASKMHWNLVLACDLPYLSPEWLDALLRHALRAEAQAFLPSTSRGLEPLAAVYRRDAYSHLAAAFTQGIRKVTDALARVAMETIAMDDFGKIGEAGRVLENMNTPKDLQKAEAWWNAQQSQCKGAAKYLKPSKPEKKKRRAPRPHK